MLCALPSRRRERAPRACPTDLHLEMHLMRLIDLRAHLRACPACSARVARMISEGDEFFDFVYPTTRGAVMGAADEDPAPLHTPPPG